MKKLIMLAAALITLSVAPAKAGVSFEISVGNSHRHEEHGRRESRHERHYAPPRAPQYVRRDVCGYDSHRRYRHAAQGCRHHHHGADRRYYAYAH